MIIKGNVVYLDKQKHWFYQNLPEKEIQDGECAAIHARQVYIELFPFENYSQLKLIILMWSDSYLYQNLYWSFAESVLPTDI